MNKQKINKRLTRKGTQTNKKATPHAFFRVQDMGGGGGCTHLSCMAGRMIIEGGGGLLKSPLKKTKKTCFSYYLTKIPTLFRQWWVGIVVSLSLFFSCTPD